MRENDSVFQNTDDGIALAIRIRKSKTDQGSLGVLRSLLPTGALLRPSTAVINWMRLRGWDIESDGFLFKNMRLRIAGILKFAALSNDVPVEGISTHSLRSGGTTTMFRAGYGLLEVKEWGRWKSSCFHGYLRYDMHAMRGVGKIMATEKGLFEFAKMKPTLPKAVTFRSGGKKKKKDSIHTQSQSPHPDTMNLPPVEITELLSKDIASSVHLWYMIDNPEHSYREDLVLFGNRNAVFYARQGRKFASELLAQGNFKQARNSQRAWGRSQTRIAGFHHPKQSLADYMKS